MLKLRVGHYTKAILEVRGIDPRASDMQSQRSTI